MSRPKSLEKYEVKSKNFSISAGAVDQELVAAVAGKRLRVVSFWISLDVASDITVEDNDAVPKALFKLKNVLTVTLGPEMFQEHNEPSSGIGKNIRIDVSGTANGEGRIEYVEID